MLHKLQNITDICPLEPINCLVVIPHYQQVWIAFVNGAASQDI